MFPFITKTWNPIGGVCPYNCVYCWAKTLIDHRKYQKYRGEPRIIERELKKKFTEDDFVFVQDMSDLFAYNVPTRLILRVLDWIKESPAKFLLLTKNPTRYIQLITDSEFSNNITLGCTIESDHIPFYLQISGAPTLHKRLVTMTHISRMTSLPLFISIEPILEFTHRFSFIIKGIRPWGVAIGYDNYKNGLDEPALSNAQALIDELESFTTVYRKTIRKAWWEPDE